MNSQSESAVRAFLRISWCAGLASALGLWLAVGAAVAAEPPARTFEFTLTRAPLPVPPRVLQVQQGERVRLRVTSEVAGELHLHAYRLEVKVGPGVPAELAFSARATGRFRVEWHAADATRKSDHHGPALAVLEVRPK